MSRLDLKNLKDGIGNAATEADVLSFVELLASLIETIKETTDNDIKNLDAQITITDEKAAEALRVAQEAKKMESKPGRDGLDGKDGRDGRNGVDGVNGKDGRDGRDGKDGEPGKDGTPGKDGKDGNIKDLSPDEIRDSLELLKGDERLDKSAIKGLTEEIERLSTTLSKLNRVTIAGSGSSRGNVKALDLSSQLNGSLRTFNIQAVWRVISVHLSSFPNVLRENVDYTWTPTSLTLTSQIDDAALSAGQTLIVIVAE